MGGGDARQISVDNGVSAFNGSLTDPGDEVETAATYRHEQHARLLYEPGESHSVILDNFPGAEGEEEGSDGEEEAETSQAFSRSDLLTRAKVQIDIFCQGPRTTPLILTGFNTEDRHDLHAYAGTQGVSHVSQGTPADRRIHIQKWSHFEPVGGHEGEGLIDCQVAKTDQSGRLVKGAVKEFKMQDAHPFKLVFQDSTESSVNLSELNDLLQAWWSAEHRGDLQQPLPTNTLEDSFANGLVDGCDANWHTTSKYAAIMYDHRHWMANFMTIVKARKGSVSYNHFICRLSDCLYQANTDPAKGNTVSDVKRHCEKLRWTEDHVAGLNRRFWRRKVAYHCPKPPRLVQNLLDLYVFFKDMKDPETGGDFFAPNHEEIFLKELKYVQQGLLSDRPNMSMYQQVGVHETGLKKYRCLRTSSPLEGYHMHLFAAIHPAASHMHGRAQTVRSNLFDFAWNVKAGIKANVLHEAAGCMWLWLLDYIAGIMKDVDDTDKPVFLQHWVAVDTTWEPLTRRGVLEDALKMARGDNETSPMRSKANMAKLLQHKEELMEGNVVALKRLTGLHVTAMQCKAIVEHHYLVAQAVPLLEARGYKALQQNLRSGGGLEAVGALPLQQPPVGQAPPPGALLPAGVINAGAAVVHQVVPVEEEEEAFGDVDAAGGALEEEAGAELEVRETALEKKKRMDKERLKTKRNALTQEQKDATKKKDREDKQTKRDNEGPPEGDARKQKRRSADARRGAVRVGAAPRAPSNINELI